MENFDLKHYLKIYRNAIPKEICDNTVLELNQIEEWKKHGYTSGVAPGQVSYPEDFLVVVGDVVSTYDILVNCIWDSTFKYLLELNFPWYTSWAGFSDLKFNKYLPGTSMRNHCDHINSIFDSEEERIKADGIPLFSPPNRGIPTLSVLTQLNDEYSGGELVFWNNEIIELNVGDIVVFPSNFLYPHKVNTITDGVRYSMASWVI